MFRSIEVIFGLLIAAWSLFVAGYYLNSIGFTPLIGGVLIWAVLLQLGIALAAILDSRGTPFMAFVLWSAALLLSMTALLSITIIGLWLLPGLLVAFIIAVLSMFHDTARHRVLSKE